MKPVHLFVSYSHLDKRWVEPGKYDLVPMLVRSLRRENVTCWCDPELNEAAGVRWPEEIQRQIDRAQIALLLISQNFLNSDFIRDVELPWIKQRLDQGRLSIIPVVVGEADWGGAAELKWLTERQMLPAEMRTLFDFAEKDLPAYERARIDILRNIRNRIAEIRKTQAGVQPVPDVKPTEPLPKGQSAGTPKAAERLAWWKRKLVRLLGVETNVPESDEFTGHSLTKGAPPKSTAATAEQPAVSEATGQQAAAPPPRTRETAPAADIKPEERRETVCVGPGLGPAVAPASAGGPAEARSTSQRDVAPVAKPVAEGPRPQPGATSRQELPTALTDRAAAMRASVLTPQLAATPPAQERADIEPSAKVATAPPEPEAERPTSPQPKPESGPADSASTRCDRVEITADRTAAEAARTELEGETPANQVPAGGTCPACTYVNPPENRYCNICGRLLLRPDDASSGIAGRPGIAALASFWGTSGMRSETGVSEGTSCSACRYVNRFENRYCNVCGHLLWQPGQDGKTAARHCSRCGHGNPEDNQFCHRCGWQLQTTPVSG